MSGTIRVGLPSAPFRPIGARSAKAPHASARIEAGRRTRAATSARWARQVLAIRLTDSAVVLLAVAASVAFGVWTGLNGMAWEATELTTAGVFVLVWFASLCIGRTSEARTVGRSRDLGRVAVATLASFGLLSVINGLVDIDGLRAYLTVGLPSGLLLLIAARAFWQFRLDAERARGLMLPRVLIAGATPDITFVLEKLGRAKVPHYEVAGVVFLDGLPESDALMPTGFPEFGGIDAVTDAIEVADADVVMLASNPGDAGEFARELSWQLETSQAELELAWCLDSVDQSRVHFDLASGLPLIHVTTPTFSGSKYRAKRAMDILLSGLALAVLAPVFGVIALLIRCDSKGPVLFRQERVGVDGTTFSMIKFRSMVTNAEADLEALKEQNEGNGVLFKLRADPRVTRLGAVLRRYSLDELPQLWNIFVGDMSIVGPRPPLACEVELYDDRAQRRLYIKPGLTGAWQVGGRSDLSWDESIRLDLQYVENWSLLGDLKIMWRTVSVVANPVGAY